MEAQSQTEGHGGSEAYDGQEVAGELVGAGSDAAEVLDAAEHGLRAPAVPVAALVMLDRAFSVSATGDHGDCDLLAQGG